MIRSFTSFFCVAAALLSSLPPPARAADDLTIWREIPVFHHGRVMPLDSFANAVVEIVCKTTKGKLVARNRIELGPTGYFSEKELADPQNAPLLTLFPEGQNRTWSSAELLLSWMAEPEKWEDVPFIEAGHEELRRLIGLKSFDSEPDVIAIYQGKEYRLLFIGAPERPADSTEPPPADPAKQPKVARLQSFDGTEEIAIDSKEVKLKEGSALPQGTPSATGHRLKYVSPRRIAQSKAFADYLRAVSGGRRPGAPADIDIPGIKESAALTAEVRTLAKAYTLYRHATFDPREPVTLGPLPRTGDRTRLMAQLSRAYKLINPRNEDGSDAPEQSLRPKLAKLIQSQHLPAEAAPAIKPLLNALESLVEVYQLLTAADRGEAGGETDEQLAKFAREGIPLDRIEPIVEQVRFSARALADALAREWEDVHASEGDPAGAIVREVAYKAQELADIGLEMHLSLYDTEESMMVVPALNPAALSKKRESKDAVHPWLSLTALLYGSPSLLDYSAGERGYPRDGVEKVRKTYGTLVAVYRARNEPTRDAALVEAEADFAAALRELSTRLEPRRAAITAKDRDDDLLRYTAYPAGGQTVREVSYNSLDPFKWSWMLSLVALCCYAIAALPAFRGTMVWVAFAVQTASILWTIFAFYLRISVTGWAPVTNMFETVVFVPFVAAVLGAWFLILPMIWTGIESSWRLTAAPFSPEETPLTDQQTALLNPNAWRIVGGLEQLARIGIMAFLVMFLAVWKYGDGERPLFNLLPDLAFQSSFGGLLNKTVVWLVGLVVLGMSLWLVPRVALTLLNSLVLVPLSWARNRDQVGEWQEQTANRFLFGLAGTAVAFASTWVAWSAPADILNENFSPLQPVLRSNFWLTIHVLTIVASYGAGMLALMLGNVGLFFYLFGSYRVPIIMSNPAPGFRPAKQFDHDPRQPMLPPEVCGTLADYCYRVIQVAVVLLATGTILGGLWADVSWGRFWGWDPKEVWALITLLVYLAILHGRFAGWFNDFGMVAGTVVGACAIMFSWYGVNFILPLFSGGEAVGLHSYGFGAGGQEVVGAVILVNLIYLGCASARYMYESSHLVEPVEVEFQTPEALAAEVVASVRRD